MVVFDFMKSFETPDPKLYSVLPPKAENLELDPNDEYGWLVDQSTGDRYYEISQAPRTQMLVARLLKGVLPVSDVLVVEDSATGKVKILSKEMNLEETEDESCDAAHIADAYFLDFVFRDNDHGPDKNMVISEDFKKHFLYDFGESEQIFGEDFYVSSEEVMNNQLQAMPRDIQTLLRDRLQSFVGRLESDEGLAFVQAVLASIPDEGDVCSEPFEIFLNEELHDAETLRDYFLDRAKDILQRLHRYAKY